MKQKIPVIFLLLILCFSLITVPAFAASEAHDGLEVTLTTDKAEYRKDEKITVTLTVKNTNDFAVSGVSLKSLFPDGYLPENNATTDKQIELLNAGETAVLTVTFVAKSDTAVDPPQPEKPDGKPETPGSKPETPVVPPAPAAPTAPANPAAPAKKPARPATGTVVPVASADPAKPEKAESSESELPESKPEAKPESKPESTKPEAADSSSEAEPQTDAAAPSAPQPAEKSGRSVWITIIVLLAAAAAACVIFLIVRNKKGRKFMSLFLCAALCGAVVPLRAEAAGKTKMVHAETVVTVEGKPLKLEALVQYSVDSGNSESEYTRGEWVETLVDFYGYPETGTDREPPYTDIAGTGCEAAVKKAIAYGILIPDAETFDPNAAATREFAAVTAVRAAGCPLGDDIACDDASEIAFRKEAAASVEQGLLALENNRFYPQRTLSADEGTGILKGLEALRSSGKNMLAGLEWTTNIPNDHFIYGQGPVSKPEIRSWLTDGIFDDKDYANDHAKVVGFNVPGYLEFDLGGCRVFRQVRISSAATQSFQQPIKVFAQMKIEAFTNGVWRVICDASKLPYASNHAYVFGCTGNSSIAAEKLRFSFAPEGGLGFNVFNEIEVLGSAPSGSTDGELIYPASSADMPVFAENLPDTLTAAAGEELILSVKASVTDGGTLSYQWYRDETPVGENSSSFTIPKASSTDAGSYKVVVTNTAGGSSACAESAVCTVTVTSAASENILKGVKYTTSLKDGGANAGTGNFHDTHPDTERSKLTDGAFSDSWSGENSVGYHRRNPVQPVDLTFHIGDTPRSFRQIRIGAFSMNGNGILLPGSYKIEIKHNTSDEWHTIYDAPSSAPVTADKRVIFAAEPDASFEATDIRFTLAPASFWVFLDEIEVFTEASGDAPDGILKEAAPPSGENIALNRPYDTSFASAKGSYYPRNPDKNYELSNGIKAGDPSYLNSEWTGYLNPGAVTICYDLGESANISAVKTHVYTANKDGITSAGSYTVRISNDGIHWTDVHDDHTGAAGQEWLIYRAPEEGVRGRFVQVTMKTGIMLFLDEIEIWGTGGKPNEPEPDPAALVNQAKGKAYYLSACDPANEAFRYPEADKAVWPDANGSLLTDGVVDASGDPDAQPPQWVGWKKESDSMEVSAVFNLKSEKAIHEITADFAQDAAKGAGLPSNMQVWVSNEASGDNISWIKLYDEPVSPAEGKTAKVTYTVPEVFRARYVKLVFRQTTEHMALGEITINGKGSTDGAADPIDLVTRGMSNLSQGRQYEIPEVSAQHPDAGFRLTDGQHAPENASDPGWTGFDFPSGGVHSITLDLNDVYSVSKLSANFLTKENAALPHNVQFIVSQDNVHWQTVYNGRSLTSYGSTYNVQTFLENPVKARYVKYYFYAESGTVLLDEISVYGDPAPVTPDPAEPNAQKAVFLSYRDGEVRLLSRFNDAEKAVYTLGAKGPNSLFEFKTVNFVSIGLDGEAAFADNGWNLMTSNTDCFGPYVISAVNNPTCNDTWSFTGGNHGHENTGDTSPGTKNTPTAKMTSFKVLADGTEVSDGYAGYADTVTFEWTNDVQANNTKQPDGSGRAVLRENYRMVFDGDTFAVSNDITFLEDCKVKTYYGLQLPNPWASDGIKYLNAANTEWNSVRTKNNCGDTTCSDFVCKRGKYNCQVSLNPNVGLGSREHMHTGFAAFNENYAKAYFHLFRDVPEPVPAGSAFRYEGSFRYFSE